MSVVAGLTAAEMKYEAQIIYESIASANAPGFIDSEWSVLLTQAQEKVVKNIIKEGIDKNEENRRAIESLIKFEDNLTISASSGPYYGNGIYAYKVQVPSPSLKVLDILDSHIKISATTPIYVKIKPVSYEYIFSNHNNPFRKPSLEEDGYFWRVVRDNTELIITDRTLNPTNDRYVMTYVKRPEPIIVTTLVGQTIDGISVQSDCQLHHSIHREIVKQAATLAYAYLQEQTGYQIQKIENKESV